jgi:hypothetical protein
VVQADPALKLRESIEDGVALAQIGLSGETLEAAGLSE